MIVLLQAIPTTVVKGARSGPPRGFDPGKQERSMELTFVPRTELKDREWDDEAKLWDRPKIDRATLQ